MVPFGSGRQIALLDDQLVFFMPDNSQPRSRAAHEQMSDVVRHAGRERVTGDTGGRVQLVRASA